MDKCEDWNKSILNLINDFRFLLMYLMSKSTSIGWTERLKMPGTSASAKERKKITPAAGLLYIAFLSATFVL